MNPLHIVTILFDCQNTLGDVEKYVYFCTKRIIDMATRYLDPKSDLTFKKVFGEHPDLVISFLNALLPFKHEE